MIVCAGEALFDLFAQDGADDGRLMFDARIGGSPLNVAMGLARLGRKASFLSALSTDLFGERLWAHLERENIGAELAVRTNRPTTLSVVGVDLAGVPSYAFYGEGAADRSLTEADLPQWPDAATALHIGSYSMVVDPVGDTLAGLARRISDGCLVSYDPNVRPTIEPDMDVWRARLNELLPSLAILKISAEDFGLLFGTVDIGEQARRWLEAGPSLVVVTGGKDGADAWTRTRHVHRPGQQVDVVDTVGAGDTFQAALLARLDETGKLVQAALSGLTDDEIADLIDFAVQAAAITCSRRGADLPYRRDLDIR